MKNENTIRQLLGMTQEDIATLFGISRGRWAMFEIGRRSLPLAAQQLLAALLSHMQSNETAKRLPQSAKQQQHEQKIIESLLHENEYQQLLLTKKTTALEIKCKAKIKTLQVTHFLSNRAESKSDLHNALLQSISGKASRMLEIHGSASLFKLQLKQELLILEQQLLESKLQKPIGDLQQ